MAKVKKEKTKKPFYKKWWVWLFVILLIGVIGLNGNDDTVKEDPEKVEVSTDKKPVVEKENELTEEEIANAEAKTKEENEKNAKDDAEAKAKAEDEKKAKDQTEAKAKEEAKVKEESVPREHKSALKKAELYANTMHMSKAGTYEQLTSEYGENFPPEAAQYAMDNIVFDWKESALKKAEIYAETMSMSDSAIYDQLVSEYGEKFTPEEAQYALDNLK